MFTLKVNYGGFKEKAFFKVIKEGYDWVLCSADGSPVYFPKEFGRVQ